MFVVISMYRPPNTKIKEFNMDLEGILDMISKEKKKSYSLTVNINTLNDNCGVHANYFTNSFVSNGYFKLITKPTRIFQNLGLTIYTNCSTGTIITDFSDHYSVFVTGIIRKPKSILRNAERNYYTNQLKRNKCQLKRHRS